MVADVWLSNAMSMDRDGFDSNYKDPAISCRPCNEMMSHYDKNVVRYAVATGLMPLHEPQREDFVAYHTTRANENRRNDLFQAKYHSLSNWESIKKELQVPLRDEDIAPLMKTHDRLTGQQYCHCTRKHCPPASCFRPGRVGAAPSAGEPAASSGLY